MLFLRCSYQSPTPVQKNTIKKLRVLHDISKDSFALPKVTSITWANYPQVIKTGKPQIKIDSSNGGAPFFDNYGTEQGLPLSSVFCSAMTKQGTFGLVR